MGIDHKGHRYCDGCGRTGKPIHRVHKGNDYCAACYKRDFLRVDCTTCTGTARVHRRAPEPARCRTCLNSDRRCARCDRPVPIAGCAVPGGVACPSCAVHFRSEATCSGCGKQSRRLSSGKGEFETGRLCNVCQNKTTHATCTYCRRYRLRAGTLESGKAYCQECGAEGAARHHCPDCGEVQAGKGRGRCRACLNRERLLREGRLAALSLSRAWVQQAIVSFGDWLYAQRPNDPKLPKLFLAHVPFFERLEASFEEREALTAEKMLDHFSVAGLRKHLVPMSFMKAHFNFDIPANEKNKHAEHQRIEDILRRAKRCVWLDDLVAYRAWLTESERPVRTRRLYMSTAAAFLNTSKATLANATERQLRAFLVKSPGARNNLSIFLGFARDLQRATLILPSLDELPNHIPESAKRLRKCLTQIEKLGTDAPILLLERAISIAFGLAAQELSKGAWTTEAQNEKYALRNQNQVLEVPKELVSLVEQWRRTLSRET